MTQKHIARKAARVRFEVVVGDVALGNKSLCATGYNLESIFRRILKRLWERYAIIGRQTVEVHVVRPNRRCSKMPESRWRPVYNQVCGKYVLCAAWGRPLRG